MAPVDLDDVAALTGDEGHGLLAGLPDHAAADPLVATQRLRDAGHRAALVAAVLTQARLRHQVRPRLGGWTDQLLFTPEGAEQVTRPEVARHRARRFTAAGVTQVTDLAAGIGGDALSLAAAGLRVAAVERDPVTAAVLAANAHALGLADAVTVTLADAADVPLTATDVVFADPARRASGRRLTDPEEWSPPLSWLLARPGRDLGLKVAPGLDHTTIPDDTEAEYVSIGGTLVELALYRGVLRDEQVRRRATVIRDDAVHFVTDAQLPEAASVGGFGAWLFEPDPAVIRSGLVAAVAEQVAAHLIDPLVAYLSGDRLVASPFVRAYAIDAVLPFQLKRLRAALRARDVGQVVVKKRGFAADPDRIRAQLRLERARPNTATVVLTRVGAQPYALITTPAPSAATSATGAG